MIRRLLVAIAASVLMASPALSLSCLRPDVARSYGFADEAEERYIVVQGVLTFDPLKLPQAVGNESPRNTEIPGRMTGKFLSKEGFEHSFDRPVTLNVGCLGPWCAGASSGEAYLAFLQEDGSGYSLAIEPCGGMAFANPTEEMLQQVTQCMAGGECTPATQ